MSQEQEQEFANLHIDRPESPYRGYRDSPYIYDTGAYRREQQSPVTAPHADAQAGINPTFMMQMRLGLLIVSLILWVIVFFSAVWTIVKIPANLASIVDPLVFVGLLIFTLLAALGNFFFGRRK
ncbi:MAG TPA: hypothetical protein VGF67_20495 [Ktedonobacteraceae bacterium]